MGHSIAEKRELIYWFLDSHRLAAPGAEMILRRLLSSDALLERTVPVNQVPLQGNLLLVAARGTYTYPFVLRLNGQVIYEVEKALELLETEEWDTLQLYLSINRSFFCQFCAAREQTVEENTQARQELTREMLLAMIDQALDHRDRKAFEVLTGKLKQIEEQSAKKQSSGCQ